MSNTNWSEPSENTTAWARNSGIDTSVPTYSDSTVSYSDPLEYYNGYPADTITSDDVRFSAWSTDSGVNNSGWTDTI